MLLIFLTRVFEVWSGVPRRYLHHLRLGLFWEYLFENFQYKTTKTHCSRVNCSQTPSSPHPTRLGSLPSSRQKARERVVRFILPLKIWNTQNHNTRPQNPLFFERPKPEGAAFAVKNAGGSP